jgi:hypothetical protein
MAIRGMRGSINSGKNEQRTRASLPTLKFTLPPAPLCTKGQDSHTHKAAVVVVSASKYLPHVAPFLMMQLPLCCVVKSTTPTAVAPIACAEIALLIEHFRQALAQQVRTGRLTGPAGSNA